MAEDGLEPNQWTYRNLMTAYAAGARFADARLAYGQLLSLRERGAPLQSGEARGWERAEGGEGEKERERQQGIQEDEDLSLHL